MKRLPSFVKLFSLFAIGCVLTMGGEIAEMQFVKDYAISVSLATLSMIGLLLTVVSLFLIALKLFIQLDRKPK